MTNKTRRADLAAMIVPLGRALMAAERPVLAEHGLTMWAYAVLLALEGAPVRTQTALADALGTDKTRLIPILDDLQERELIVRLRDPADRRAHVLSLTPAGRQLRDRVQAQIQRHERLLLDQLDATDRATFLRVLAQLRDAAIAPPFVRDE